MDNIDFDYFLETIQVYLNNRYNILYIHYKYNSKSTQLSTNVLYRLIVNL
jgi:hypothetical protein